MNRLIIKIDSLARPHFGTAPVGVKLTPKESNRLNPKYKTVRELLKSEGPMKVWKEKNPTKKRVFIVRHAVTGAALAGASEISRGFSPIFGLGVKQAEQVRKYLVELNITIDEYGSSDLERSNRTAEIIAGVSVIKIYPFLKALSPFPLKGIPKTKLIMSAKDYMRKAFNRDPIGFSKAHNRTDIIARSKERYSFFQKTVARSSNSTFLLVGHSRAIPQLVGHAMGLPLKKIGQGAKFLVSNNGNPPAGITILEFDPKQLENEQWELLVFGDESFMPEELKKNSRSTEKISQDRKQYFEIAKTRRQELLRGENPKLYLSDYYPPLDFGEEQLADNDLQERLRPFNITYDPLAQKWEKVDKQNGAAEVDLFTEFDPVNDLGKSTPIVLVAKGEKDASCRAFRLTKREEAIKTLGQRGYLTVKRRKPISDGFMATMKLDSKLEIYSAATWIEQGKDPRGFDINSNNIAAIAFSSEIRLFDMETKKQIKTITHPKFLGLHSLVFSKTNPNLILTTSTAAERILKIDIRDDRIIWEWNPWKHGYAKNKAGLIQVEKGDPILKRDNVRIFTNSEIVEAVESGKDIVVPKGEVWVQIIDFEKDTDSLPLISWQKNVSVNWANFSDTPGKIHATLFKVNKVVEIDEKTGEIRLIDDDTRRPHGFVPFAGGYITSDTVNGRVKFYDKDYKLSSIYYFKNFPIREGLEDRKVEWIQHTYPISKSLLATIDQRRNHLYIWDPAKKIYTVYPYNPEWSMHEVKGQLFGRYTYRSIQGKHPQECSKLKFLCCTQYCYKYPHMT